MLIRYLTHPQVQIDPRTPVPEWGLSAPGRDRVARFAGSRILVGTVAVVSSAERKAIETAEPIAAALGVNLEVREAMHENDRSATGYLPAPEFEKMVDAFFAGPEVGVQGWERAIDAQARIVREVRSVLATALPGDVLFVGHGGVGTLLYCHFGNLPINRRYDQPGGGGHFFTIDRQSAKVLHGWRAMEAAEN